MKVTKTEKESKPFIRENYPEYSFFQWGDDLCLITDWNAGVATVLDLASMSVQTIDSRRIGSFRRIDCKDIEITYSV